MSHPNDCPDPNRLRMLLDSGLPDDDQARIQSHLETCESCQRKLESLVAGKESWCGAARQLAETFVVHEPALEDLMKNAKQSAELGSSYEELQSSASDLNFLEPAVESGVLGRLGHYEVIDTVGRGGMGVVLKAFDSSLRRIVAIKVMSQHLAANAAARKRFVREAQAAAAVAHEHVVAIHAVADKQEPPFIVMQFIEGKTLQDRLDGSGPLALREILRIGMQTAAGLAAAHAQGLVHRDVKPANILLENGVERVKLTDFGLARVADDASMTHSGMIAGTPQFMSPEQARGDMVDLRSDLFSLGSVMYAMCVGHSPFRATTAMGVLKRVCDESPRPIREVNPDIPEWMAGIISKLLAKNPSERFQSAQEAADLMSHCLAHVQQPLLVPLPSEVLSASAPSPAPAPSRELPHDQLPPAKPIVGVWRDGATLVMHKRAQLPDRCVKTNQPTEHFLPRHLYWHRPILYLLFFLNPLIFIVVARMMAKTAEIQVGLSRHWMVRRWWAIGLGWIGFLVGAALSVVGLVQMDMAIMLAGIAVALIAGVCSAKVAEIVSVAQIDGEYVFLRGVCSDYLATLPAWNTNEAADPFRAERGAKSAIPVVHPMFVALFWLGWFLLAVVVALVVISRLRALPANVAVTLSWPLFILLIAGQASLVLTVLLHAFKNRDWRATPLGRRPLIGVAVVSALLVVQMLLLPPLERRSFVHSPRVEVPENNVIVFSADPDPALTKQLRELIAQHEENRKTMRKKFEAGNAAYTDMLDAEIALMDAKIRLATAENRMNDVTKLHEELVKTHEEYLKVMQTRFENGVINESDLMQVRTKLTEARIKLETHRKSIAPTLFQVLPREK